MNMDMVIVRDNNRVTFKSEYNCNRDWFIYKNTFHMNTDMDTNMNITWIWLEIIIAYHLNLDFCKKCFTLK